MKTFKKISWLIITIIFFIFADFVFCETNTQNESIYIEPPLEFQNMDLKTVLITIFAKVNVQYIISENEPMEKITFELNKKDTIDNVLNTILVPLNIPWEKDKYGIYHIKKREIKLPKNIITTIICSTDFLQPFSLSPRFEYERLLSPSFGILGVFRYDSRYYENINSGIGGSIGIRWYPEEKYNRFILGTQIQVQHTGTERTNQRYDSWLGQTVSDTTKTSHLYICPAVEIGYRCIFWNFFTISTTYAFGYGLDKQVINSTTTAADGMQYSGEIVSYHGKIIRNFNINIGICF